MSSILSDGNVLSGLEDRCGFDVFGVLCNIQSNTSRPPNSNSNSVQTYYYHLLDRRNIPEDIIIFYHSGGQSVSQAFRIPVSEVLSYHSLSFSATRNTRNVNIFKSKVNSLFLSRNHVQLILNLCCSLSIIYVQLNVVLLWR